jgi:hypothetical protein
MSGVELEADVYAFGMVIDASRAVTLRFPKIAEPRTKGK